MIDAASKCMPLPDPDLIRSCRHHLLFLIPLQYLYLPPPSNKGGGGEEMLLLGRPAGAGWLAEPRPEGICCW